MQKKYLTYIIKTHKAILHKQLFIDHVIYVKVIKQKKGCCFFSLLGYYVKVPIIKKLTKLSNSLFEIKKKMEA